MKNLLWMIVVIVSFVAGLFAQPILVSNGLWPIGQTVPAVQTTSPEICNSGVDEDQDGYTDLQDSDCGDQDQDGYSTVIDLGAGLDCDDADLSTHPGAPEPTGGQIDRNCDGNIN